MRTTRSSASRSRWTSSKRAPPARHSRVRYSPRASFRLHHFTCLFNKIRWHVLACAGVMQRLEEEVKVNEYLANDQLPKELAALNKQIAYLNKIARVRRSRRWLAIDLFFLISHCSLFDCSFRRHWGLPMSTKSDRRFGRQLLKLTSALFILSRQ